MKSLRSNQQGIGHVVALLVLVLVAAVAFAGWRVMNANKTSDTTARAASQTPSVLKTKADVTKAANELDATSVDSTVNPDSLDSDINSLL